MRYDIEMSGRTAESVERYVNILKDRGVSEKYLVEKRNAIRHCIGVLGSRFGDIEGITPDDIEYLDSEFRNLSKRSYNRYMTTIGEIVAVLTGINPYHEYLTRTEGGCLRPEAIVCRYGADLDAFRMAMRRRGLSELVIDNHVATIIPSIRVLLEMDSGLTVESIDAARIRALDEGLADLTPRSRGTYLINLGTFVECLTGTNPYLDYKAELARENWNRIYLEEFRFGKELTAYRDWMVTRHYRPATIQTEVESVVYIMRRIDERFGCLPLEDITPEIFADLRFNVDDLMEGTMKLWLIVLGQFVEFVTGENPYDARQLRWTGERKLRRFLTDDEWNVLMANADETERIITVLGSLLGMRRMEIANLRVEDIHPDHIRIYGKGSGIRGKPRDKPLDGVTRAFIQRYEVYRQGIIELYGDMSGGFLLISDGKHKGHPLSPRGIGNIVDDFAERVGVEFHAHCFRRYYATTLYEQGVDLVQLKEMMRHSSLETTLDCYINVDTRKLARAQAEFATHVAAKFLDR